jgi:uncharacterized protein (TIGR03118 family)
MPYNLTILKDSANPDAEYLQSPWGMVIEQQKELVVAYVAINHGHNILGFLPEQAFEPTGEIIRVDRDDQTFESPTAIVKNCSCDFIVRNEETDAMHRSKLIIATTEGSLYGFSPFVDIDRGIYQLTVEGAEFTGMAINDKRSLLYVCDYANNVVRTFDGQWNEVTADFPFADPELPEGYSCFGIVNTECKLFVCYSSSTRTPLSGYVNEFDYDGRFIKRYITDIGLDGAFSMCFPPPECWGRHQCLFHVANTGSGLISTYSKKHGKFDSYLKNMSQEKLEVEGLRTIVPWGNRLYYTASADGGVSGQLGSIKYI